MMSIKTLHNNVKIITFLRQKCDFKVFLMSYVNRILHLYSCTIELIKLVAKKR